MKYLLKLFIILTLSSQIINAAHPGLKEDKALEMGKAAASLLGHTLIGRIKQQMKLKDDLNLVNFCKLDAQNITAGVNKLLPNNIVAKRTSLKYRSKFNKPSKLDRKVLEELQTKQNNGINIKKDFKFINQKNKYIFYKPIFIKKACLKCHGMKNSVKPIIKNKIANLYPNDTAYDYKLGDLRGVFVVEILKEDKIDLA